MDFFSDPPQWVPIALMVLGLLVVWTGVILQWRDGGAGNRASQNLQRNIGRYFSAQWVKERIHLILTPIAVVGVVTFLPIAAIGFLDYDDGTMPALVGILLVAPFFAGPILMIGLCISIVRNGRPRFLVPPHEREEPNGLELKRRYASAARKRRRR